MECRRFEVGDLDAVIELCAAEGWESYTADAERTCRALSATGVITVVAVEGGKVCGFAQLLTDGAIRAYLANIAVAASRRGTGIGRRLISELFIQASPVYIDLLSTESAASFYDVLPHRRMPGYRLYQGSGQS
jgi:ribosomal protein S18 acetylase RimI-like enzyme